MGMYTTSLIVDLGKIYINLNAQMVRTQSGDIVLQPEVSTTLLDVPIRSEICLFDSVRNIGYDVPLDLSSKPKVEEMQLDLSLPLAKITPIGCLHCKSSASEMKVDLRRRYQCKQDIINKR